MFEFKPKWKKPSKEEITAMAKGLEPAIQSDGSTYKVPLTTIVRIEPHPNADRLELAYVYNFQVIIQKGKYQVGSKIIYIPVDSLIPKYLEDILFPEGSKIKLYHSRVKQIKIRQAYSQGMIVDPSDIVSKVNPEYLDLEQDLSTLLEIVKYEPPAPKYQSSMGGSRLRDKPLENPYFRKFNGISNIRWFPNAFEKGEEVVMQCKLHGSHIRFGKAPFVANTLWKKIKKLFGLAPKFESVYGSNNVELTNRNNYKGFYGEDVYGKCLSKFHAFDKIKDGEFVHAELIGPGVQRGYDYGHTEHHMVIFDVRVMQPDGTQKWLNPEEAEAFANERGFDFVPVLYRGPFSEEMLEKCTRGKSAYCPKEIKEGCVVKSRYAYDVGQSKKALKSINPEYLETDPSDNH
jgi:RNA ligase (TIGR02306 family)